MAGARSCGRGARACSARAAGLEVIAAPGLGRDHHRDVVLELRAVGGVQVDEQRRLPPPPTAPGAPRISGASALMKSRFRLSPVAVVRNPISSGPRWLGRWLGPNRSWPSTLKVGTNTTVDPRRAARAATAPVSRSRANAEPGVLAVDLAGVDPGLDQQHRPPGARVGGRVEAVARQHQRHQLAAGRRRAEGLAASGGRVGDREVVAQPHRLGVAAGGEPARALAGRGQVARDRRVVGAGGGEDGEAQPAAHRSCLTQIARARHCRTGVAPVAGALHPGAKVTRSACR
jgi:hypothetical protein